VAALERRHPDWDEFLAHLETDATLDLELDVERCLKKR
jgi:hypothetical protein